MIKIIIIDKQNSDRNRTHAVLSCQSDFEVVGLGQDGYDALKLAGKVKPDIAILDICLDFIDGTESIPLLKAKSPATAILLLTSLEDEEHICKAVSCDVQGYLLKETDMDTLAAAIRLIHGGGRFISSKINGKVYHILSTMLKNRDRLNEYAPFQHRLFQNASILKDTILPAGISKIEIQIMAGIGQGHSTKEIAEYLCLSVGTVRNYISSAMQKAGLQHRTQIPLFALKNGLIKLGERKMRRAVH
ncbi:MAG: response regulator transcription factor [Treponema sp.]|jgi:DNA-binding NarL/FixJ family response regulator|nr:response regulator transcription factor [Treponema sp.]